MANKKDRSVTPTPRTASGRFQWRPSISARTNCLRRAAAARPDRRLKTGSRQNASCTQDEASSNGATASHNHSVGVGRRLGGSHSAH